MATMLPNGGIFSLSWMQAWLAEIGYMPEQVKTLDIEAEMIRDYETEQQGSGEWKSYKPGNHMSLVMTMHDGSKFCQCRTLWESEKKEKADMENQ